MVPVNRISLGLFLEGRAHLSFFVTEVTADHSRPMLRIIICFLSFAAVSNCLTVLTFSPKVFPPGQ